MPVNPAGFHYTTGMPIAPFPARPRMPSRRKLATVLLVVLLVAIAHLSVIEWLKHELQLIVPLEDGEDSAVSISLHAPPDEPAAAKAPPPDISRADPVAAVPVAEPPAALPPAAAVPEPAPATPAAEPAPAPQAADSNTPADQAAGHEQAASILADNAPARTETDAAARPAAPALFEKASPPPAAVLSFSVTGVRKGKRTEGSGSMSWRPDGGRYTLTTEIGVLFFTLLTSRSQGELNALGVVPELYAEKRIGRSETNTHFHRARQQISFSASTTTTPVEGGEQDRATWVWQLASLGRGDPDKFEAGLALEMTVAGIRAADRWRIYVNGRDKLDLPDGPVSAWRLSVIPGPDSFERQFDLWLAPERDWYPVRLRHEDRNGNSIDMQLKKITTNQAVSRPKD